MIRQEWREEGRLTGERERRCLDRVRHERQKESPVKWNTRQTVEMHGYCLMAQLLTAASHIGRQSYSSEGRLSYELKHDYVLYQQGRKCPQECDTSGAFATHPVNFLRSLATYLQFTVFKSWVQIMSYVFGLAQKTACFQCKTIR